MRQRDDNVPITAQLLDFLSGLFFQTLQYQNEGTQVCSYTLDSTFTFISFLLLISLPKKRLDFKSSSACPLNITTFEITVPHSTSVVCGMWFKSCFLNRGLQKTGKFLSTQSTPYNLVLKTTTQTVPIVYNLVLKFSEGKRQKICNKGLLMKETHYFLE